MADEQNQTGSTGLATQGASTEGQQTQGEGQQQDSTQSNPPKTDGMPNALGEVNPPDPKTNDGQQQKQSTAPEKYEPLTLERIRRLIRQALSSFRQPLVRQVFLRSRLRRSWTL